MSSNRPEESGVDHRVEPSTWFTDGSGDTSAVDSESPQASPGSESAEEGPRTVGMPLPGKSQPGGANGAAESGTPYPGGGGPRGNGYPGADARGNAYPDGGPGMRGSAYPGVGPEPRGTSYASADRDPRGNGYPGAGADPRGNAYPDGGPGMRGSEFGVGGSAMSEHEQDGFGGPPYQRPVPPYPAQVPPAGTATSLTEVASKVTQQLSALKTKAKAKPRPRPPARPARTGQNSPRMTVGSRPQAGQAPSRRAQLTLARIEPWSVMKFSFMVSLVGWVVLFVAVAALYYILSKLGVFHSVQNTITSVTSSKGSAGDDSGGQWFSASRVLGYTMLIGAINVVLITALATVGAVIYNLVTHLAGGIEVTLKESD